MQSEIEFEVLRREATATAGDAVVIPLTKTDAPPRALAALDGALGGLLARVWSAGDFTGKSGETLSLPVAGIAAKRVVLIGMGEDGKLDAEALRAAGGRAAKALARAKAQNAAIALHVSRRVGAEEAAQALVEGVVLGAYRFDKYKSGNDKPPALERVSLLAPDGGSLAVSLSVMLASACYAAWITWRIRRELPYSPLAALTALALAAVFVPLAWLPPEPVARIVGFSAATMMYGWLLWKSGVVTLDELQTLRRLVRDAPAAE